MKDQFIEKAKNWDKVEWKIKLGNKVFYTIKNNVKLDFKYTGKIKND